MKSKTAKNKKKKISYVSLVFALILIIVSIGGTVTFSRYYSGYEKDTQNAKVATTVTKINVNSIYRIDSEGNRIHMTFDKNADSVTLNDFEPEDKIEYYFTVSGIDGKTINEVNLNVTLSISIKLVTISAEGSGQRTDYFAGWTLYTEKDGVKNGGYLEVYHGAENESGTQIRPAGTQTSEVDFTGNSLTVTESTNSIVNKTGLVMNADASKKEYAYHLVFTLPKQDSEKENYAGARVFFDIQAVAEQSLN